MEITVDLLRKMAGGRPPAANMQSVATALSKYGKDAGLDVRHRTAHFLAQLLLESGGFRFDREVWGPTAAQKKYEGRADLGNTVRGDGKKFAGRGPIQLTGRGNVNRFEEWCRKEGYDPPDFTANPDLINTDPWEGLSAIWFWSVGNQTGKSLNVYADENNIIQITKKINGGLNGFEERTRYYTRAALVLLGYEPDDIKGFQREAVKRKFLPPDDPEGSQVDGDAGPQTWAAMHLALVDAGPAKETAAMAIKAAPVTADVVVDVASPGKGIADVATGGGLISGALAPTITALKDQLTPFTTAGGWINALVIVLIVLSALLVGGGLLYRWWANRERKKIIAELNAKPVLA